MPPRVAAPSLAQLQAEAKDDSVDTDTSAHARRRVSKKAALKKHEDSQKRVQANIRISKSTIKKGGGGVFWIGDAPIKAGTLLGFYRGARTSSALAEAHKGTAKGDYVMEGERGGRDGFDPDGRLLCDDHSVVDVHDYGPSDWSDLAASGRHGIAWQGVHANFTRFLNHASGAFQNASLCTTSERFGRSHAIYAKRRIDVGEEIFISYGKAYWDFRKIAPEPPEQAA